MEWRKMYNKQPFEHGGQRVRGGGVSGIADSGEHTGRRGGSHAAEGGSTQKDGPMGSPDLSRKSSQEVRVIERSFYRLTTVLILHSPAVSRKWEEVEMLGME